MGWSRTVQQISPCSHFLFLTWRKNSQFNMKMIHDTQTRASHNMSQRVNSLKERRWRYKLWENELNEVMWLYNYDNTTCSLMLEMVSQTSKGSYRLFFRCILVSHIGPCCLWAKISIWFHQTWRQWNPSISYYCWENKGGNLEVKSQ